jgi:tetratricopeptide (TPR) repeat protein
MKPAAQPENLKTADQKSMRNPPMFELHRVKVARVSALLVVSLALVFTAGCNRDPNVRKQKYLESGRRYEAAGKYKEAVIQFSNALKVDKNFADAHFELAKTYLKMGGNSVKPGYQELLRTEDLAPNNLEARIDLGNIFLATRSTDRAAAEAKAVLAVNPNYADAYALLGAIAQRGGDNAEARKDIQKALAIEPNRPGFHSDLAMLEAGTPSDEPAAEQELQKAASLDPKSATPHLLLATLLDRKGDIQGTEQQLIAAIGLAPKNLQARGALANLYFRAGDKAKAEQALQQAVADNSDNEAASAMLLQFYGRTQQMDRAESVFADLTSKYPKSFGIRMTYAQILFDKKDYAKATTVANQLTKTDAANPQVQSLNALLLMNTGKIDDALTLLKKAVKDNPDSAETQLLLARVEGAKGDLLGAVASFREVDRLSPGNLDAARGIAQVAMQRNDAGMLSEIADKTLKLHPDFTEAIIWRGTAEANSKEFDKAEADYQAALKTNPNAAVLYLELGQIRYAQNHIPEGNAMMEKTLELDPNSVRALGNLVAFDLQAKQPAKAIARVQAQIAKAPGNGEFYAQLSDLQLRTKDFKGALESSQKAMQLSPTSADAIGVYTQAQVAAGNVDAAISTWQGWVNSRPNDAHAIQVLGSLEEAKGDDVKAMDDYKKALQIDPNDGIAANNLAYLTVETEGNIDVALSLAQTARRIYPDTAETADTLAWVYYHKDEYEEARDLLESALRTYPNDASIHLHLGLTYSKLNDKSNAELHLKKAAALAPNSKVGKDASAELAKLS